MKIKKIYIPLLLGAVAALGIFVGDMLDFDGSSSGLLAKNERKVKLNKLIDYIEYEYVDDVNTDSIVSVTVNGILDQLDPHSVYIPQEDKKRLEESMKGDFVGIGISYYPVQDTITVIKSIKGGPSYKAGIRGGDRILYADDVPLFGKDFNQDIVSATLKGQIGSTVDLRIKRPGQEKLIPITVGRGTVPLKSVQASYMLTDNLGYIKIDRFAESTHDEFVAALNTLKSQGATQLALDMRDNSGGFVYPAERIADEFLEDGKLIVYTQNKTGKKIYTYAKDEGLFEDGEVFVLINENTASAAEILTGALQDNDKGLIVGRRSFGKGLVQREMDLGDGSAVRLTIARYYTPTGRSIQRPYEEGKEAYYNDYKNRYDNGELRSLDSIQVADSLKFTTPLGKIVYGGGGITPDVFVPKNVDYEMEHLSFVLRSGYMDLHVFELLEKDRVYYNGLTQASFISGFEVSDAMVEDFLYFTKARGISLKVSKYTDAFKKYLKASIAQQLYGSGIFEKMINEEDPDIQKIITLSTS